MGIICDKHNVEMKIIKTDGLAKNWTAVYQCPKGHKVTIKHKDWDISIQRQIIKLGTMKDMCKLKPMSAWAKREVKNINKEIKRLNEVRKK